MTERPARIFDVHSHWGTRRGYPFQTEEELAQQERVFRSKPRYVTEAEMAEIVHDRCTRVSQRRLQDYVDQLG